MPALVRAYELQRLLDSGEVNTRAEIAKRYGISRARVTQIMSLLGLPKGVQEEPLDLPEEEQARYSERGLRKIAALETEAAQARALGELDQRASGAHSH